MYVDETVLKFMGSLEFEQSLMQNETVDATVVFIDICRFTSISETEKADTHYHLDRAIDASLAVRNEISRLPNMSTDPTFRPNVSIGINSGEMVSGNIGSVNLRRLDYTVIGDAVNVAQRLQSLAGEGQIISRIGEVSLKHKTHPVSVYEVLD